MDLEHTIFVCDQTVNNQTVWLLSILYVNVIKQFWYSTFRDVIIPCAIVIIKKLRYESVYLLISYMLENTFRRDVSWIRWYFLHIQRFCMRKAMILIRLRG